MIREKIRSSVNDVYAGKEKIITLKTINASLENFPQYLQYEGKAKNTATTYLNAMAYFQEFIKNKLNNRIRTINDLNSQTIKLYVKHLTNMCIAEEISPATAELRINSLRVYLRYLTCEFEITEDMSSCMKQIKKGYFNKTANIKKDRTKKIISLKDVKKLVSTIENSFDKNSIRDTAIVYTLISTGCRRSELLNLRWCDIDLHSGTISINRDKTSTHSKLSVNRKCLAALQDLHDIQIKDKMKSYIFRDSSTIKSSDIEKPLSTNALSVLLKKWGEKAEIETPISPSTFRHTFVSTLISGVCQGSCRKFLSSVLIGVSQTSVGTSIFLICLDHRNGFFALAVS